MLENHDFFGQIENDKIRDSVFQGSDDENKIMADEYQLKRIISVNSKQHDVYSFLVTGTDNILNTRSSM